MKAVAWQGAILSQDTPVTSALEAYEAFDQRRSGWMKVSREPSA